MINILLSAMAGATLCLVFIFVYAWARFELRDPWCPIVCGALILLWCYTTGNFIISLFSA